MRKVFLLLIILSGIGFCAPDNSENLTSNDSVLAALPNSGGVVQSMQELKAVVENLTQDNRCLDRYKLYPTTNNYNLLKLDTRTGIMMMVQWSLEDGKEFQYTLNERSLVSEWNDYGCGTFELYPTKNHYQFILLNKVNGNIWHVQWGFEKAERWIRRIY